MGQKFETIKVEEVDSYVYRLTLNRPEVRNALSTKMAEELTQALDELSSDSRVRALILAGEGDKAFCAGADLKERNGMSKTAWAEQHLVFEKMIESLASFPRPTLASLNGVAFGGGLEIALACSFACAVEESVFSFSEVKLGIIPGLGGIYRLCNLIGSARAKELLVTGRRFTSEEGEAWGVFNHIYKASSLEDEVLKLAKMISLNAPLAVEAAMRTCEQADGRKFEEWTELERANYNSLIETADRKEGIQAFNEKRKAKFLGE